MAKLIEPDFKGKAARQYEPRELSSENETGAENPMTGHVTQLRKPVDGRIVLAGYHYGDNCICATGGVKDRFIYLLDSAGRRIGHGLKIAGNTMIADIVRFQDGFAACIKSTFPQQARLRERRNRGEFLTAKRARNLP